MLDSTDSAAASLPFKELAGGLRDGTIDISHNMAILCAIVGGTEMGLDPALEFDPRAEFWRRPERRFVATYLANRWPRWPADPATHDKLATFALRLAGMADQLRNERKLLHFGTNYDTEGGLPAILAPLRAAIDSMPPAPEWDTIRPKKDSSPTASQSLLLSLDAIASEGFDAHTRGGLRRLILWWPLLGARSTEDLERRQRFFWAYRHVFMSSNAYSHAGAQYFGPIVNNTPTQDLLRPIQRWKEGATLEDAPLLGLGKDDDEPVDRSHTNIAREIWGFLNLHRTPFYNNRVKAYGAHGENPEGAVREIGARCRAWLEQNPAETESLASTFDQFLHRAKRNSSRPFAEARRWKSERDHSAFDAGLRTELQTCAAEKLGQLRPLDRAAILIHLALDMETWTADRRATGESRAEDTKRPPTSGTPAPIPTLRRAPRVWVYAPGEKANHWDFDLTNAVASIAWDDEGDLRQYESEEVLFEALTETHDGEGRPTSATRTCWDFSRKIEVGDPIIARQGRSRIRGIGVVTRAYFFVEGEPYGSRVGVDWIWSGEHVISDRRSLAIKTLVESSRRESLLQELDPLLREMRGDPERDGHTSEDIAYEPYSREDALADLFIPDERIDQMLTLLRRRKNLILQGPPGVGKTFVAKRLAYLLMEERAEERVKMVQFHQAYTYEQFVRGYRPESDGGFSLANGPLYDLAEKAKIDPDNAYVLVIDEINRGNLGKILGEAMVLLEPDKRSKDWAVRLAYTRSTHDDDEEEEPSFYLPDNLYVIGTMNTADRSLAVVDYALRRRFVFVDLRPGFDVPRFAEHLGSLPTDVRVGLQSKLEALNRVIMDDPNLGPGFEVGHSYFCKGTNESDPPWTSAPSQWLDEVLRYEILPLLSEYWFDDPTRLSQARTILGIEPHG